MHHDHQANFAPARDFSNPAGHPMGHVSCAAMLRHSAQPSAIMGADHDLNHSLHRTLVGIDDPRAVPGRGFPAAANGEHADPFDLRRFTHHRMVGMRMAFAASGGLRTVGELAPGNDPHSRARFARIARGIARREIIGFMWQGEPWVPMFQFAAGPQMLPRKELQPLFELLVPLYDAWEMANWFTRPNQWLSGHRPVDDCARHLAAVLDVAHLEHFIATGKAQHQTQATRATCN